MKTLLVAYPKCSTCQKAKKWLEQNHISFEERHVVENNPKKEELRKWISLSKKEIKKFFNTSGLKYKELNLKEKLSHMTEDEKLEILASDGMLVKRPLIVTEDTVLVGFKLEEWAEYFKSKK